jgi:hypothetical protein
MHGGLSGHRTFSDVWFWEIFCEERLLSPKAGISRGRPGPQQQNAGVAACRLEQIPPESFFAEKTFPTEKRAVAAVFFSGRDCSGAIAVSITGTT